jgi:hypothetical protein
MKQAIREKFQANKHNTSRTQVLELIKEADKVCLDVNNRVNLDTNVFMLRLDSRVFGKRKFRQPNYSKKDQRIRQQVFGIPS